MPDTPPEILAEIDALLRRALALCDAHDEPMAAVRIAEALDLFSPDRGELH